VFGRESRVCAPDGPAPAPALWLEVGGSSLTVVLIPDSAAAGIVSLVGLVVFAGSFPSFFEFSISAGSAGTWSPIVKSSDSGSTFDFLLVRVLGDPRDMSAKFFDLVVCSKSVGASFTASDCFREVSWPLESGVPCRETVAAADRVAKEVADAGLCGFESSCSKAAAG
jgi:hypothetical protein